MLVNGELAGRSRSSLVPPDDRPGPPDLFLSPSARGLRSAVPSDGGRRESTAVFAAGASDRVPDAAEHARFSSLLVELKDEFDAILVAGPNLEQHAGADGPPPRRGLLRAHHWLLDLAAEAAEATLMPGTRPGAAGLVAVRDRPQWLRSLRYLRACRARRAPSGRASLEAFLGLAALGLAAEVTALMALGIAGAGAIGVILVPRCSSRCS